MQTDPALPHPLYPVLFVHHIEIYQYLHLRDKLLHLTHVCRGFSPDQPPLLRLRHPRLDHPRSSSCSPPPGPLLPSPPSCRSSRPPPLWTFPAPPSRVCAPSSPQPRACCRSPLSAPSSWRVGCGGWVWTSSAIPPLPSRWAGSWRASTWSSPASPTSHLTSLPSPASTLFKSFVWRPSPTRVTSFSCSRCPPSPSSTWRRPPSRSPALRLPLSPAHPASTPSSSSRD